MLNGPVAKTLAKQLFRSPRTQVYAVLDGASVPELLEHLVTLQPAHICLYRGDLEPGLARMAPYLVQLEAHTPFLEWLLTMGWGEHWGIYAVSGADLRTMRSHFRSLLTVRSPEGKRIYFRFYDPRVLRTFLPTCNEAELDTMFGPVNRYMMEAEDPASVLTFRAGAAQPATAAVGTI